LLLINIVNKFNNIFENLMSTPQKDNQNQPPVQNQQQQQTKEREQVPQVKNMDVDESKKDQVKKVNLSTIKSKNEAESLYKTFMDELKANNIDPFEDIETIETISSIKKLVQKFQGKERQYVKDLESTGMKIDDTILQSVISPPPNEGGQKFANFVAANISLKEKQDLEIRDLKKQLESKEKRTYSTYQRTIIENDLDTPKQIQKQKKHNKEVTLISDNIYYQPIEEKNLNRHYAANKFLAEIADPQFTKFNAQHQQRIEAFLKGCNTSHNEHTFPKGTVINDSSSEKVIQ
jgi:hypothetical protein